VFTRPLLTACSDHVSSILEHGYASRFVGAFQGFSCRVPLDVHRDDVIARSEPREYQPRAPPRLIINDHQPDSQHALVVSDHEQTIARNSPIVTQDREFHRDDDLPMFAPRCSLVPRSSGALSVRTQQPPGHACPLRLWLDLLM
jgi:hypothetical protein